MLSAKLIFFVAILCQSIWSAQARGASGHLEEPLSATGFGDRLLRTFNVFAKQPLTMQQAQAQGWHPFMGTACNAVYSGIPFAHSSNGPSEYRPTFLIYTPAGQLSGFGVRVWGSVPSYLISKAMFIQVQQGVYDVFLNTRDPDTVCSSQQTYSEVLGDRLLLNGFFSVPLNMSGAQANGWVMGDCIGRMGIHHAFDLASPGNQTWNDATLVPLQPMYDAQRQTINAIFFNVGRLQVVEPIGMWEGPLPNFLMCLNWCRNTGCHFDGVTVWSVMHWHFVDPGSISCHGARCVL